MRMKYQNYRVYVENERIRTFKHFINAKAYGELKATEICHCKGIGHIPEISISQGSGSDYKEWNLTTFGWD